MADYVGIQSGDDQYAPEHIGGLAAAAPVDEYIDYGLDVTLSADGTTISVAEGKCYVVLDTALAEWTDDSSTSHQETIHRVLYYGHYDARSGLALADTTAPTNYVFADLNYEINDDPRIIINTTGDSPGDDALEIARVDPVAGKVDPRNQFPSGTFGSLTVEDQLTDPADVVHTGELADAEDIPTDADINQAVNENATHGSDAPHDYYTGGDAVQDINNETTLNVDITGEAGSVAGGNVVGPVAEADHATEADNADTVGNISPSDFLRTDTRDQMFADADWNDHAIDNLSGLTFSSASGTAIDLRPGSDGTHYVVEHDDPDTGRSFGWHSNPGNGEPFRVMETTDGNRDLLVAETDGTLRAPEGDVYSEEGRLASQQWANGKFLPMSGGTMNGTLDMDGEALVGLAGMQAAGSEITVRDPLHTTDSVYVKPQPEYADQPHPDVDIAIGDHDTGIGWVNDGILGFYSNGVELFHLAPDPEAIRFGNKIGMGDDIRLIQNNLTEINQAYFTDVANGSENNYVYFENGDFVVNPQGGTTRRY